jgi:hypothetical protein
LQYISSRSEWIADVVVFKDVEPGVFREEKLMRNSQVLPVLKLKPVTASYVRSSDGWKVPLATDGKSVVPSSPGFDVGPDFALPVVTIDRVKALAYEQAYEALKLRLLKETALFGAAGTLATVVAAGPTNGATFALGVAFGAAYLVLLERNTDQVMVHVYVCVFFSSSSSSCELDACAGHKRCTKSGQILLPPTLRHFTTVLHLAGWGRGRFVKRRLFDLASLRTALAAAGGNLRGAMGDWGPRPVLPQPRAKGTVRRRGPCHHLFVNIHTLFLKSSPPHTHTYSLTRLEMKTGNEKRTNLPPQEKK